MTTLPARGITPGLPTNSGSFKATERAESGLALAPLTGYAQDYVSDGEQRESIIRNVEDVELALSFNTMAVYRLKDVLDDLNQSYRTAQVTGSEYAARLVAITRTELPQAREAVLSEATTSWGFEDATKAFDSANESLQEAVTDAVFLHTASHVESGALR